MTLTAKIHTAATSPRDAEIARLCLAEDAVRHSLTGPTYRLKVRDHSTSMDQPGWTNSPVVHALPATYSEHFRSGDVGAAAVDLILSSREAGEVGGGAVIFEYKVAPTEAAQPIYLLFSARHDGTSPSQITSLLDRLHGTPKPDPLNGYEGYNRANWDGYNAEPITPETLKYARRLLRAMPSTFGPPDVAPSADGSIGLEWVLETGPLHKLFLDIGPSQEWWAYWRRRSGEIGRLSGTSFTPSTPDILRKMFDDLSS